MGDGRHADSHDHERTRIIVLEQNAQEREKKVPECSLTTPLGQEVTTKGKGGIQASRSSETKGVTEHRHGCVCARRGLHDFRRRFLRERGCHMDQYLANQLDDRIDEQ